MRIARHAGPLSLLLATLAVTACAPGPGGPRATRQTPISIGTPSGQTSITLTHDDPSAANRVEAAPDRVWQALVRVYEALDAPVDIRNDISHRIGVSAWRTRQIAGQRMSRWMTCGSGITGDYADSYRVTLTIQSQVAPADSGATIVTRLEGSARPTEGASGQTMTCHSRGTLEWQIVQAVTEQLAERSAGG